MHISRHVNTIDTYMLGTHVEYIRSFSALCRTLPRFYKITTWLSVFVIMKRNKTSWRRLGRREIITLTTSARRLQAVSTKSSVCWVRTTLVPLISFDIATALRKSLFFIALASFDISLKILPCTYDSLIYEKLTINCSQMFLFSFRWWIMIYDFFLPNVWPRKALSLAGTTVKVSSHRKQPMSTIWTCAEPEFRILLSSAVLITNAPWNFILTVC